MPLSSPSLSHLLSRLNESHELFPILTLCNCVSDAEESKNGPRYCAQDKFTKCMYEVRCTPMRLTNTKADYNTLIEQQHRRLEEMITASRYKNLAASIALPIDAYLQEASCTGETFIISVSSYTGLSLSDVVRSGWRYVEETDFEDILSCVEEYGRECMRLPPHRNLTLSAVMRQLDVRVGAVEMNHQSRWVIGDWLLLADDNAPVSSDKVLSDLEWLLHLAFSKLNVSCEPDGNIMRKEVVEIRINKTIERIREGFKSGVWSSRRTKNYATNGANSTPIIKKELLTLSSVLSDRVEMHQQKLRQEQKIIHSYRQKARKIGTKTAAKTCHELSIDNADESRRRMASFPITLCPSEALCNTKIFMGHGLDVFCGRKDAILVSLFQALDASARRENQRRQVEWDTKRMERETIRNMLLRTLTVSTKMIKAPANCGILCAPPQTRSAPQPLNILPPKTSTTTAWASSPRCHAKSVDSIIAAQASTPLKKKDHGRRQGLGVAAPSPTKRVAAVTSVRYHDANTAAEEQFLTQGNSPRLREIPTLGLRNFLDNISPNGVNTNRRIDRISVSPKKNPSVEVIAAERSPLGMVSAEEGRSSLRTFKRLQPPNSNTSYVLRRSFMRVLPPTSLYQARTCASPVALQPLARRVAKGKEPLAWHKRRRLKGHRLCSPDAQEGPASKIDSHAARLVLTKRPSMRHSSE